MSTVYLLLGGNQGDRLYLLSKARELIEAKVGVLQQASSIYETAAWGKEDLPSYLNQVLCLRSSLPPLEILNRTQAIEQALGRIRLEKWGARTMDIDFLYLGQKIIRSRRLVIPHPLIQARRFVLKPLVEIAPNFVHPIWLKTNEALLKQCTDTLSVTLYKEETPL